jgi:F0F1-type ATP synthase epsilon subunit
MFKVSVLDIRTALPVFQEVVECVILPTEEGELSVLDFHQPIISKLKKGVIRAGIEYIPVKRGIAKMQDNELVVLVETDSEKSAKNT